MTTQTPPTFNVVVYGTHPGFEEDDENEAELDIEVAGGAAPNANLIYVNSVGVDNALFYAIEQNLAPIVSYSFGSCELPGDQSILDQWFFYTEEANAQGMTILVASGDQGAVECDSAAEQQATQGLAVEIPADVPGVTSVGGTSFAEDPSGIFSSTNNASGGSLLQYAPESVWDESPNLIASGGGASSYFAKPYWQGGAGVPADGARDVPDLALFSGGSITNPEGIGYATCTGNQGPPWDCSSGPYALPTSGTAWAGTSASTPTFAGIVALLNQYLVSSQVIARPGLGNINPQLYLLGEDTSNVFHAITGNSDLPCQIGTTDCSTAGSPTGSPTGTLGYAVGPGSNYNMATGLGSVDGYNLVHEWSNYASAASSVSLSTNQTYPTDGTPIVLTANVTGSSTNGAPTGTATFYSWDCVAAGLNSSCLTVQGTSALNSNGQATLNIP
jgi:subtilase family serine protease